MSKPQPETNLAHYLEAAKSWETDQIGRVVRSERRAWRVAIAASVIAALAVLAVVLLTPLKTVEPFVVRVDKLGESDVVTLLTQKTVSGNEALDKYWLNTYVNYREEYSRPLAFGNFRATELLSSQQVRQAYVNEVNPKLPQSPTVVYGADGSVEVSVNSIAFIAKGQAQVRYTRNARRDPGSSPEVTQWIATIAYDYVNPPMDEQARLINPVGFRITDYRIDPVTSGGG